MISETRQRENKARQTLRRYGMLLTRDRETGLYYPREADGSKLYDGLTLEALEKLAAGLIQQNRDFSLYFSHEERPRTLRFLQ